MESQYFIFDGVKSSQMDLYIMRIEQTGFMPTPYIGSVNIHESKSRKRIKPYFYGVDREPIEFPPLQLVLMDKYGQAKNWTSDDRSRIARWLIHDEYKPFQTTDDLGKYYYVLAISDTDLNLINSQGYMEVVFRTNSPYAFSPIYRDFFDLSNNNTSTIIEIENKSNILKHYNPLIKIKMEGGTEVEIKNLSSAGKVMKIENLLPNETIEIDCQNRIITSDKMGQNPFAGFVKHEGKRYWMDLVHGKNRLEISGRFKVEFTMQFPILQ